MALYVTGEDIEKSFDKRKGDIKEEKKWFGVIICNGCTWRF